MNFTQSGNPTMSALYLVDRDKQGKAYRWFDAETDQWGMCGTDMNEALENKSKTAVGFFPWVGPLTGPNFKSGKDIKLSDDKPKAKAVAKPAKKRMAKSNAAPKVKTPKAAKVTHPDGTVFFRADRQKWVAVVGGKQEAARPTAEACMNFLMKKYGITGVVLK